MIFLVDRKHPQRKFFKRTFRVMECIKVDKEAVKELVDVSEDDSDLVDPSEKMKHVNGSISFYRFRF